QKVKRIYGLLEKQFRLTLGEAERRKGVTGENLLNRLESRIDTFVYRAGFANSRNEARQLVLHGHFKVNGRKVNSPSYVLRAGDAVELREKSRKVERIVKALEAVDRRGLPSWVELDKGAFKAVVKSTPVRAELTLPITEQLIVELYSK
ncbi:30S ribosomal protein S4, partial [bacterium]